MNEGKRIVVLTGLTVVVVMGLFPPWSMDVYDEESARIHARYGSEYSGDEEVWYRFAFASTEGSRQDSMVVNMFDKNSEIRPSSEWKYAPYSVYFEGEINTVRLIIQWVIVIAITSGSTLLIKAK
jgi:hypothetical protein